MRNKKIIVAFALFIAANLHACGNSDPTIPDPDPDPTCFENPQTYQEIINSCTDDSVVKIEKNPVLPLLNADGTLPPLP